MQTLEQRVARLERSCWRWRLGFLVVCVAAAVGASKPADAEFGHLTVGSLTVRSRPDGAFLSMTCDKDQASIKMASPTSATLVALTVQKDAANMFVSRTTDRGITSAAISADEQSGFIDLRNADGKNKELEPQ
jgi:hypothetical protein